MASANLSMVALLALIVWRIVFVVWRIVFAGLRRRQLVRENAAPQSRNNNFLRQGLNILERTATAVIAADRFERSSDGANPLDRKDRAETYLRHIVTLTGATQMGNGYVLDVGRTRFHVRDRYVRRLRDLIDPKSAYEETCFYPVHKDMPKAEEIATALLQLTNNPALFDKWSVQNGLAFKADGQVFTHAQ